MRTCPCCKGPLIKHGFLEKEHTQRYRCKTCVRTFSDAEKRQFGVFRLNREKIIQVINLLTEGSGIRSTARIVGVHRDTVLSILRFAGKRAENLLHRKLVDVEAEHIEIDEIWTFVYQKHRKYIDPEKDKHWTGDYYTFLGMDSQTKLMFLPHVAKRTKAHATTLMEQLAGSIKGRVQLTTDGFPAYRSAVKHAFGERADFAQYYKEYNMLKKLKPNKHVGLSERKNVMDRFLSKDSEKPFLVRSGTPDPALITTSRIERANLTVRHGIKRFNRGTMCHSKDEEYLHYAVMLFVAHYDFVRPHESLDGRTPAMGAGLEKRKWRIGDLLRLDR